MDQLANAKAPNAADEVLSQLSSLVKRFDNLTERLNERLNSVMREPYPMPATLGGGQEVSKTLPPLFQTIRQQLNALEESASRIQSCIERTEL